MKKARLITILFALVILTGLFMYFRYMSSEVTETFILLEQQVDQANKQQQLKNDSITLVLTEGRGQASERGRFLDSVSNELDLYLSNLKKDMTQSIENDGYEAWESSGYLDALFFEGTTISQGGNEFIERINVYRMAVSEEFKSDFPEIIERMEAEFSTAPVLDDKGRQQNWLPYNFKGFPLVAAMTKITQMQSDMERIRHELFSALVDSK
ncbi:MAG: hypothetical protein AAF489_15450 [Bacteroidota bacterium]